VANRTAAMGSGLAAFVAAGVGVFGGLAGNLLPNAIRSNPWLIWGLTGAFVLASVVLAVIATRGDSGAEGSGRVINASDSGVVAGGDVTISGHHVSGRDTQRGKE
jgi:hypothetical protein